MGTVYGPVVVSAFHTGSIWLYIVSIRTVPKMVIPTTGTASERGWDCSRLVRSTQPHYFSSLEERLEFAFDGDSQGNIVHSHTGYDITVTVIDYSIVCV